jgi:hypothetical protein
LHQVGDLFELNVKLRCQNINESTAPQRTENIKAIPLQAWTGPEVSRRLRLPDFKTIGT